MSRQLAISAAFSVFALAALALLGSPGIGTLNDGISFGAHVSAEPVMRPMLEHLLPALQ